MKVVAIYTSNPYRDDEQSMRSDIAQTIGFIITTCSDE
jgi:hypothetical protein